jgi:hypothetical protein
MSSNITPTNIDGNYPIAGQDNSSQGFRDNFTNIRNNLTVAKNEISDLQSKTLLKSSLTGLVLDNDMEGTVISNLTAVGMRNQIVDLGTVSGSQPIDFESGHTHVLIMNGSTSLSFNNFPTDAHSQVTIYVTCSNVAHTLALTGVDSANYAWLTHINTTTDTITFPSTGTYQIKISSTDGTTFYIDSLDLPPNNISTTLKINSEGIASSASIGTSNEPAIWFNPSGNIAPTVGAGVANEIRIFARHPTATGNVVITVINAGWKTSGSGTITMEDNGDGCILQYLNSKWICIGNNGCTFA